MTDTSIFRSNEHQSQTTLSADRAQIEKFVTLFKYASDGFISYRAFTHEKPSNRAGRSLERGDDGKYHFVWPSEWIGDLDRVVDRAVGMAEWCANQSAFGDHPGVVFCPPVVTLAVPWSAKTKDIACGVALSLDCDGPDQDHPSERSAAPREATAGEARPLAHHERRLPARSPAEAEALIRTILGPPSILLLSGSRWCDASGTTEDKRHIHYRLATPTGSEDEHKLLREARNLAARLIGSDRSASSLVHPLRWPGSWNCKNPAEPRMARIIEFNDEVEIDLYDCLYRLRQAAEERGLDYHVRPTTGGIDFAGSRRTTISNISDDDDLEGKTLAAMEIIQNNNMPYADWINIGMAIWDGTSGSSAGCSAWHQFSAQSSKYDEATTDAKWRSFGYGSVTCRTLFKLADETDPTWRARFRKAQEDAEDFYPESRDTLAEQMRQVEEYHSSERGKIDARLDAQRQKLNAQIIANSINW